MNVTVVILVFGIAMVIEWVFALCYAQWKIMENAFFGEDRPLQCSDYRIFLGATLLLTATLSLSIIVVSFHDPNHPELRNLGNVLRLLGINLVAGIALGAISWQLFKWQSKRMAKFHHPTLAAWKKVFFWGPKKRRMTKEERTDFLHKMDAADYAQFVAFSCTVFALLPLVLLWLELTFPASPKNTSHSLMLRLLDFIPAEISLIILGYLVGTFDWLLQRLFAWLGWTRTLA
jgi:hypothetical protein